MRKNPFSKIAIALAVLALVACLFGDRHPLSPPIVRAEFTKLVSVTGGSAQRLSNSLVAAGYSGATALDELTMCVPDANVNTMYLGSQSNVNASTGFALSPGTCITYTAAGRPVEATSFYTFVATTENMAVSLRSR